MKIAKNVGEQRMACAKGLRERANSNGLTGRPCLDPLEIAKDVPKPMVEGFRHI